MHTIIKIIVFSIILIFAQVVYGATHYVASDGTDTWANSTNISTPCSISTAMANAEADDIVYLRGGTYSYTGNPAEPYHAVYEPTNSGTDGHPIIFQNYSGETPTFQVNWGNDAWTGWILGSGSQDYITFDGITITTTEADENAGFWLGSDSDLAHATGIIVKNCTIEGGSTTIPYDDNYDLNRMEDCDYCKFQSNTVGPFPGGTGGHDNYACLKLYHIEAADISGNNFENCEEHPISSKSYNNNTSIYNNFFSGGGAPYFEGYLDGFDCDGNSFYNNLVVSSTATDGVWYYSDGGGDYADNLQIYSNTFYMLNATIINLRSVQSADIYNNIIVTGNSPSFQTVYDNTTLGTVDHNIWQNNPDFSLRVYGTDAQYANLSAWQSSGELIGSGNPGEGSVVADPSFANGSGNLNTIADFEVSNTSGRSGALAGADVSQVGVDAIDTTAPTVSSATVDATGSYLDIVFSEAVTSSNSFAGFSVEDEDPAITLTYSSGDETSTIRFSTNRTVYNSGTEGAITLDYDSETGDVTDMAETPNALETFADQEITNNSGVTTGTGSTTFNQSGSTTANQAGSWTTQ
jgi:hypothetical protein